MKKILLAALLFVFLLSACGNSKNSEPIPLKQSYNSLKTEEGIEIKCSNNYVLGVDARGQFWFDLSDQEYSSKQFLEDNYDWKVQLSSNAKIVEVDFYNYEGELLGTQKCKNNVAVVDYYYNDQYCHSFTLYIKKGKSVYTANFVRTGM